MVGVGWMEERCGRVRMYVVVSREDGWMGKGMSDPSMLFVLLLGVVCRFSRR